MNAATLNIIQYMPKSSTPVHAVAIAADGKHLLVGEERALLLYHRSAEPRFRYALPSDAEARESLPFIRSALAADMKIGLALQRSGELYRLDFEFGASERRVDVDYSIIWNAQANVYDMSLSPESDLIALGHYTESISLLDAKGVLRWRRPTKGRTWCVAFDAAGETLYVGSSAVPPFRLASLDVEDGSPRRGLLVEERVMGVAALPPPLAFVAVLTDAHHSRLRAFRADLEMDWEYECDYAEYVTAIDADVEADLVAVGLNTGEVMVFRASTGEVMARTFVASVILSVSIAGGRHLATGLGDGQAVLMEYIPPIVEEEFVL